MEVRIAAVLSELKHHDRFHSLHPMDIREIKKHDLVILPSVRHPDGYDQLISNNKILIEWLGHNINMTQKCQYLCRSIFIGCTALLEVNIYSSHWSAEHDFRRLFPNIDRHIDKLLIAGHGLYINSGAFPFLNLVLLVIEKYLDRKAAIY